MARKSSHIGEFAAMLVIWLALLFLFGLFSANFLTWRTISALANRIPALTVVSAGMTLVLIIGGIDLSVGSVLGLGGALLGVALLDWHMPLALAMAVCLCLGAVVGTLNGLLTVELGIPSFIVTLGMLEVARGLAYLTTHSQTKYIGSPVEALAAPLKPLDLSPAFCLAGLIVIAGQITLSFTTFGRRLLAIGGKEQAAYYAGINPRLPKVAVFALLGTLTGLGALFYTARLGSS